MNFSDEPVVSLREVRIFQESRPVLEKVSFEVEKGEFLYVIGRTGSGKSSLLRTLYADLPMGGGQATVAGHHLHALPRRQIPYLRRKMGIVFQDFQLFPDRTVGENLRFALRAMGWSSGGNKIRKRMAEVLMQVGLGSMDGRLPHQLSGGEQQRVAIARALLNEPAIIFADEPTGNLDPTVAGGIMKLFTEINRSGTALMIATHNYAFIKDFPARVLKCEHGQVRDSAREQFAYPTE